MTKTMNIPPMHERPICKGCSKRLKVVSSSGFRVVEVPRTEAEIDRALSVAGPRATRDDIARTAIRHVKEPRRFTGYDSYSGFHTMRCALDFAIAAHAAGYRRIDGG